MKKENYQGSSLKWLIGLVVIFAIRLIPGRPANIEPVMATIMPFSKGYGKFAAFLFGFGSIALFDLATGKLGPWTLLVGATYGLIGLWSAHFFKNREAKTINFVIFSVVGTLVFDIVTGLLVGPLFFGQSFASAFFGQIPFTINHLLGNVILSALISPAIYRWVITNEALAWPKPMVNPFSA